MKDLFAIGANEGIAELYPTKHSVVKAEQCYCGEMVVGATFTKKEMEDERLRNELEVMGDRDGIQQSATHNGSSVFNKTYGPMMAEALEIINQCKNFETLNAIWIKQSLEIGYLKASENAERMVSSRIRSRLRKRNLPK